MLAILSRVQYAKSEINLNTSASQQQKRIPHLATI